MNSIIYDPSEYIRGLQQILISDKKRIAFLFGAGTSLAKKNKESITIPAIGVMTKEICEEIGKLSEFKLVIGEICSEIEAQNCVFNIESLLTNIEQKIKILGFGKLNGINKTQFEKLLSEIKKMIKEKVSVQDDIFKDNNIENLIHSDFAEWIGLTDRVNPIEIFTTNYDYLFEIGLESKNVPFYDGFTGSFQPFFNPESIDDMHFLPKQSKLWKLHGSLGWHLDLPSKKVCRKALDEKDILIYPSSLKYDSSRKQPYTALMDRLTNFLKEPDTVLITNGYSFGDEHINDRILSALNSNTTAHVLALYYDIFWKNGDEKHYLLTEDSSVSKIAKSNGKISILGSRSAVIGGKYGTWELKRKPDIKDSINIYYDMSGDASNNSEKSLHIEKSDEEKWTGKGELLLPKFEIFVKFLQSMYINNGIFENEN